VGEYLDVFIYTDDVCGQDGWLASPGLYRWMVKPKQRRLIDAMKTKTLAKVFYHGYGAVFDQVPDLIDVGVDIVNPLEFSARAMDTRSLKMEYGQEIVFRAGAWIRSACCPLARLRRFQMKSRDVTMMCALGAGLSSLRCTTSRRLFHRNTSSRSSTQPSSMAHLANTGEPCVHTLNKF